MRQEFGIVPPAIIEECDSESLAFQSAWDMQKIKDAARRHGERMEKYKDWVKPENVQARYETWLAKAEAAKKAGEELKREIRLVQGLPLEDPPLPPQEQLPKHMRGQSESTIRAMLRQEKWEYDMLAGKWREK